MQIGRKVENVNDKLFVCAYEVLLGHVINFLPKAQIWLDFFFQYISATPMSGINQFTKVESLD